MFASKYSFKLLHYVIRYFDTLAWKVDSFIFPGLTIYYMLFPPLRQISKVMNKIWSDEVEDIAFITPCMEIFIYFTIIIGLAN